MIASRINKNFVIYQDDTLENALKKIDSNTSKIIFVIQSNNSLIGTLSDGDIRRFLLKNPKSNISKTFCKDVMNKDYKSFDRKDNEHRISDLFGQGINCVPIVDEKNRIVQVAFKDLKGFFIGNNEISDTSRVFTIAEIGNNHQGKLKDAKRLVDIIKDTGADCAKFQMRNVKKLYKNKGDNKDSSADLGAQYTLDLLSKFQLSNNDLFKVFDYCYLKDIKPLCTPWDDTSLKLLEQYGMEAYKVASADLTNYPLLDELAKTGKPLICSTGMSNESEIISSCKFLEDRGVNFALLHCNSTYPTPYKDINLLYLNRLKEIANSNFVGYSGHEKGFSVVLGAVAMGAKIIEKHITLDKTQEGTDHKVSLLPFEFQEMVLQIHNLEEALGFISGPREISQGEMINRENLAKSLVSNSLIKKGEIITRSKISVKSPGLGLQPNKLEELIGKKAFRQIEKNDYFFESDIYGKIKKKKIYNFNRPFGVPVRYHDFEKIIKGTNLNFVEFHLSYKDMEEEINQFLKKKYKIDFCVHSPELFANDHILDLCSLDKKYRNKSIKHLREVISITKNLNTYFPETKNPIIVLNAGGWDPEGFSSKEIIKQKYKILSDSLDKIDLNDVQLAIQTMPPFPWHFGGQSYHNLFVDGDEIVSFCEKHNNIKICLDVSHTMMAANYYGFDIYDCIKKISPYVVHMHIVDAKGADGEGVEIGKGDVDFIKLANLLDINMPGVQFLPEVWQGHKNQGEGFWKAFNFLEEML
tara:strand:- start:1005 stop:3263 length:2259 start_codon:yes stop_codon:yes gene_type:complete